VEENYIQAQQTALAINGGSAIDVSSEYGSPEPVEGGGWSAGVLYSTGISLTNAGDTMTVTFVVTMKRNFAATQNGPLNFSEGGSPGPPLFTPAGALYTAGSCTITAV
jgi:hypothetical protein